MKAQLQAQSYYHSQIHMSIFNLFQVFCQDHRFLIHPHIQDSFHQLVLFLNFRLDLGLSYNQLQSFFFQSYRYTQRIQLKSHH
jgi:hypothetical protein